MKKKYLKLAVCIVLDAIGFLSYLFPGIGEVVDIIWAPFAGWLNYKMFKDEAGTTGALFTFLEEAMPGMDFIPSFTLTWLYAYIVHKSETAQKASEVLNKLSVQKAKKIKV